MQSVLFKVSRTDSVEKIIIWVATRENLPPDRLKAAYSATENIYYTANCVVCVLCLFLAVLWVYLESSIMVFTSHIHFLIYFPVNKIKPLIRMHGCAGCSVLSFFACSGFIEARFLIVDIT